MGRTAEVLRRQIPVVPIFPSLFHMAIQLIPYPVPAKRRGVLAARYSQAIQKHGFKAVALKRIREMSKEPASTDLMGRILRNTCLAFSASQVSKLVIREIVEVTGERWIATRKAGK